MKLNAMLAGGALVLALTGSAYAANITASDTDEILNVARGYGSASISTSSNGNPMITGRIDGVNYVFYFLGCTDNRDCQNGYFYLGFADLKPKIEIINDWNRDNSFSRAYLDQDQDAVVESDVYMAQGISTEALDGQFGIWADTMSKFADHVGFKK
ncbi:MAG: YbjN protein [Devosia sp.]|uniref:YbjN domain-containing protein n=1 Tax=Devosia sp. TaxID=1871048 RepID=UPI0026225CD0|nr:YbjN domain-containing protein [Devosia sp.]MDB5528605.1 YbjN protein [Devosia sp.]